MVFFLTRWNDDINNTPKSLSVTRIAGVFYMDQIIF